MNKITFYPDDDMKKWLEETAKKKNTSVNKFVLNAIEIYKVRYAKTFRNKKGEQNG